MENQNTTNPTTVLTTVRIDLDTEAFINSTIKLLGWTRSDLIRAALAHYERWIKANPEIVLDYIRTHDRLGG